jgi:WG containing repeat
MRRDAKDEWRSSRSGRRENANAQKENSAQPFRSPTQAEAGLEWATRGRCGFIDHSGCFVVRPEYEDVKSFSEGYAPVRQNGKWGMINPDGELAVDCRFDELGELNGGLAFAKADGKAGFISPSGSWVIQPEFDRCYPFFGALALTRESGGVYSYLRRNGDVVWTSQSGTQFEVPYVVRSA